MNRLAIVALSVCTSMFILLASGRSALSAPPAAPANHLPLKLAVLPDYDAGGLPSAETIVDIIAGSPNPAREQLVNRLGNPNNAKLLITRRLAQSVRDTLDKNHPEELLQRYIVLDFPSSEATMAAKQLLQRDRSIKYVIESQFADFAATPADPLYAVDFRGVRDYQWGANDPMNLQGAWAHVRGTAFLAHVDNGVQWVQEDLNQPVRPRLRHDVNGGTDIDEHPELVNGIAGHGTHTAGIMAAGTSQSSVPAGYPNPAILGGAGVCWYCNLLIAKITPNGSLTIDTTTSVPDAFNWVVSSGAQAINYSIEGGDHDCPNNPNDPFCLALDFASRRQVVIAASAGNSNKYAGGVGIVLDGNSIGTNVAFPARDSRTIAVGGIQSYSGVRGNLWTEETPVQGFQGSSGGPAMVTRGILAPARDVLSTFYDSHNWNAPIRCGVDATLTDRGPRYGICTGNSMATPHISGLAGLMRSVNPLLDSNSIRTYLLNSGDSAAAPSTTRGFGVPNALTAINSVLSTTNRLTPLFAMNDGSDHFYTVVPQQAKAAISGTLIPSGGSYIFMVGGRIAEYSQFPDPPTNPLARPEPPSAEAWVFSTFENPFNPSVELLPLYRLSWRCGDSGRTSSCGTNPNHAAHLYSANLSETQSFMGNEGWSFDGIEAYVVPLSQPQPAGTTVLRRAYNLSLDDYIVYPIEWESSYLSQGYQNPISLGYAYFNNGSRPTY